MILNLHRMQRQLTAEELILWAGLFGEFPAAALRPEREEAIYRIQAAINDELTPRSRKESSMTHLIHFKQGIRSARIAPSESVGDVKIELGDDFMKLVRGNFAGRTEGYIVQCIVGAIESASGLHEVHRSVTGEDKA